MEGVQQTEIHFIENLKVNCEEVKSLLLAYTECELAPALRMGFESHLERCERCRAEVSGYQLVVATAHELGDRPVSVEIQNRLRATLNRKLGLSLPYVD